MVQLDDPFADLLGSIFTTQFTSSCDHCGSKIAEGDPARYRNDRDVVHVKCPEQRNACTRCWLVHGTHQEECG